MTPKPPHDLQDAIRQQGTPLHVAGAEDRAHYVILTRTQYEQMRGLFDPDRFSHSEQRAVLRHNGQRAGWDDSEMDAYDAIGTDRPKTP